MTTPNSPILFKHRTDNDADRLAGFRPCWRFCSSTPPRPRRMNRSKSGSTRWVTCPPRKNTRPSPPRARILPSSALPITQRSSPARSPARYPDPDTQEQLYTADFSGLTQPGEYQLDVPGVGRSAPFHIAPDVYREPYYAVMRGFYLWRCGTAVSATYQGVTFAHATCHTNDAWLDYVGGGHTNGTAPKAGMTRAITTNTRSTPASRWGPCSAPGRISARKSATVRLDLPGVRRQRCRIFWPRSNGNWTGC